MREEPERLVLLDETATTTKMTRLRGRAKRGQRFKATAPLGHWGSRTFIAALRGDGLTAPWIIKTAMNRAAGSVFGSSREAMPRQRKRPQP